MSVCLDPYSIVPESADVKRRKITCSHHNDGSIIADLVQVTMAREDVLYVLVPDGML